MPPEFSDHERISMQFLMIDAAQDPTFGHEKEFGSATVWVLDQKSDEVECFSHRKKAS
jgi:hypothetical protein